MKNTSSEILNSELVFFTKYINILCKKLEYEIKPNFSKDWIRPPVEKKYKDGIKSMDRALFMISQNLSDWKSNLHRIPQMVSQIFCNYESTNFLKSEFVYLFLCTGN